MVALLCPVTLHSSCTETNEVQLIFAKNGQDYYQGFRCTGPDRQPLRTRARSESGWDMNLVIDFVDLDGVPSCRSQELRDWCRERDCGPILASRRCLPFTVELEPPEGWHEGLDRALSQLGGAIVDDAPDEDLLVRVVATVQSCEEILSSPVLSDDGLIGCMYSCPTRLDDQEEPLVLDLDASGTNCWDTLTWCASAELRDEDP